MAPNNRFRNSSSEGRNKPFKKSNPKPGKDNKFDKPSDRKFSKPGASKGKPFAGRNADSKKRFSSDDKPRGRREDFQEKGNDKQRPDRGFSSGRDAGKRFSSEDKPTGKREDFRSGGKRNQRPGEGFSAGKEEKGFFKKPRWKKDSDSAPRGDEKRSFGDKRKSYGDRENSFKKKGPQADKSFDSGADDKSQSGERRRPFRDKENSFKKKGLQSGKSYGSGDRKRSSGFGGGKRDYRRNEEPSRDKPIIESGVGKHPEESGSPIPQGDLIRLNKYISNSGVCSRREADDLIAAGMITVNGKSVTELGYKVKATDDVRYEGKRLKAEKPVYILLNKPKGFITTTDDPQERKTVMQLINGACRERVYPVGRLDRNTSGLLLLTNDGDLTEKLSHPSHQVKKIYKAELDRPLEKNDFQKILNGIRLEEGKAIVDDLAIVSDDGKTVGLELHIGWNRIVRRIFESLGYEVVKLDRSVYATLDKKELPRGHWRFLREEEIIRLKHFQ